MKTASFILLLSVLMIACTRADPEAYKIDPILQDYQAQLAATNADLEAATKQIESVKKDLRDSVPQSGQFSSFQRKLFESQSKAARLNQQVQFWKIRLESRAKEAQSEYLIAFKNKKEWPDKGKTESYFAEKRLRLAKMTWNQKDRIKDYEQSKKNSTNSDQGGHGAPAGGH